jgi:hypothetical protein
MPTRGGFRRRSGAPATAGEGESGGRVGSGTGSPVTWRRGLELDRILRDRDALDQIQPQNGSVSCDGKWTARIEFYSLPDTGTATVLDRTSLNLGLRVRDCCAGHGRRDDKMWMSRGDHGHMASLFGPLKFYSSSGVINPKEYRC